MIGRLMSADLRERGVATGQPKPLLEGSKGDLITLMMLDGPMTGTWFLSYVEQTSISTRRSWTTCHSPRRRSSRYFEASGVKHFFLPPCLADLNLTEHALAKPRRLHGKAIISQSVMIPTTFSKSVAVDGYGTDQLGFTAFTFLRFLKWCSIISRDDHP